MKKSTVSHILMALFILFVLALRIGSSSTANVSYFFIAIYALLGRQQAIQALALSWVFSILNPGFTPEASMASVGRYAVIVGASASVFFRSDILNRDLKISRPVLLTLFLGVFFVLHSLLFSPMPDVSILKALSWVLVTTTLFSAWTGLSFPERSILAKQVFGGLIIILIISLPFLLLPQGYLVNGTGFQGLMNHPQAFGLTMSILGAWAVSHMMANIRPPWTIIALASICFILVLLSEARTAGLSMIIGVLLSAIVTPVLSGKKISLIIPGYRSKRVWTVFLISVIVGLLMASRLTDVANNYITKSGRATDTNGLLSAYDASRGGLIDDMWKNVLEAPFTGIGFGIASNLDEMIVERDPLLGLPVSAAIEKGVMPLAILEELGIFGMLAVFTWIFFVVRRCARTGVIQISVILTLLLLNLGEYIFFSVGGMGMLLLILLTDAATSEKQSMGVKSHA